MFIKAILSLIGLLFRPRSEWDPQTFEERAFDLEHAKRGFEESNQRLRAAKLGISG